MRIQYNITNLPLLDIAAAEKWIAANEKNIVKNKIGGKESLFEFHTVQKALAWMEAGNDVRNNDWDTKEVEIINKYLFLCSKPMIYLVNLSKKQYLNKGSEWLPKIKAAIDEIGSNEMMIPFSVEFEAELYEAQQNDAVEEFMKGCKALVDAKPPPSMLPRIIKNGYHCLNLVHFFTSGADEVKAWTIRKGTLAPQAAGVIHGDFEKGFICAEVTHFEDFKELGSEAEVKSKGKLLLKGKGYEVEDGDIIFFKFN